MSTLLGGEGYVVDEPQEQARKYAIVLADVGGNETGMQCVGGHTAAFHPASQLVGKEHVDEFGLPVGSIPSVFTFPLQVS